MELIEKLGLDWRLLLGQVINFFLLLWILRKFAYRPILEALNRRRDRIAEAEQNAQRIEHNLSESNAERDRVLTDARKEAQHIVQEAAEHAKQVQEDMTAAARKDVEKIVSDAHKEINAAREKMLADARAEIATLVITAAGKVLEREVTEKDNARFIDESIAHLSKK